MRQSRRLIEQRLCHTGSPNQYVRNQLLLRVLWDLQARTLIPFAIENSLSTAT